MDAIIKKLKDDPNISPRFVEGITPEGYKAHMAKCGLEKYGNKVSQTVTVDALLASNADSSDTRFGMLSELEVEDLTAILERLRNEILKGD